jgi:hypothetical protein
MANHSVIEHRANYHFLKIEEDYVTICSQGKASPYCKALILATLEHWMNVKLEKGQDDFIYMTYPQWVKSVYDFFKRNVIINCLAELVEEGLILKRSHRIKVGNRAKESFAYKLNTKKIQDRIKRLPDKDEKSSRLNINASDNKPVEKETRLETNGTDLEGVDKSTAPAFNAFKKGRIIDNSNNIDTSNIDSFSTPENVSCSQTLSQPPDDKKKDAFIAEQAQQIAELQHQLAEAQANSSRLQENKAHQSSNPTLFQETAPVESAVPKVVFPDMTKDVLQRDTRQPTPSEQKRIDEKEKRETNARIQKRIVDLWELFDVLFHSHVSRYGYNKPQVEDLAKNALATDEVIKTAFEAVAKSEAVKKDPGKLNITNIANVVPAYIRAAEIKVVESNAPKQETTLEKMKRERQEAMERRSLQEVAR